MQGKITVIMQGRFISGGCEKYFSFVIFFFLLQKSIPALPMCKLQLTVKNGWNSAVQLEMTKQTRGQFTSCLPILLISQQAQTLQLNSLNSIEIQA